MMAGFDGSAGVLKICRLWYVQEGQVQLQPRAVGFKQTYTEQEGGPIKVTLHDCLACSGCVTSAETVLLQHQSTEEFLQRLRDPTYKVVVSVSPQSRASLAGES